MEFKIDAVEVRGCQRANFSLAWRLGSCVELRDLNHRQTTLLPLRTNCPWMEGDNLGTNLSSASPQAIESLVVCFILGEAHKISTY